MKQNYLFNLGLKPKQREQADDTALTAGAVDPGRRKEIYLCRSCQLGSLFVVLR